MSACSLGFGSGAAGIPITAVEDILDYEELDPNQFNPDYEYFGLIIKGSSMEPRIKEGDVVIVRQQTTCDNGDIIVVLVNGDSATCKKIMKYENGINLISLNPAYDPIFYSIKEVEELPVRILGKVVELRAKF